MKNIIIYTIPIPHDLIGFFQDQNRLENAKFNCGLYYIRSKKIPTHPRVPCALHLKVWSFLEDLVTLWAGSNGFQWGEEEIFQTSSLLLSLSLSPRERTSRSKILCRRTEGEGTWNQPTTSYFVGRDLDGVETASGGGRGGQRQRSGYVVEVVRCRVRDLPFFFLPDETFSPLPYRTSFSFSLSLVSISCIEQSDTCAYARSYFPREENRWRKGIRSRWKIKGIVI